MRILLETERLRLRQFTEGDVDNLVELDSDPEVMRFLTGGRPTPVETIRQKALPGLLREYDRHPGRGVWAAEERAGDEFVGWFELSAKDGGDPGEAELGYRLRRAAWGRGLATEGARALVRYGFDVLGLRRIRAETMAVNVRSRRVMEKAGLRYARTFHVDWPDPIPGTEHGEVEYELLRSDYTPSR